MTGVKGSQLSKDQLNLVVTAQKKRLCEQRAHRIVEMLLEPAISPDWLLQQVAFITHDHYQDVTEERSVTGCCGYPLCDNRLHGVPKHQFQISTITNRVYDIQERKKYCSSACFRASRHLRAQVPTSPLWLRDREPPPVVTLLRTELNRRGPAGDPVDLGVARAPSDDAEQMTTEDVIRGMVNQYDQLSGQIRDLKLPPERETGDVKKERRRQGLKKKSASKKDEAQRGSREQGRNIGDVTEENVSVSERLCQGNTSAAPSVDEAREAATNGSETVPKSCLKTHHTPMEPVPTDSPRSKSVHFEMNSTPPCDVSADLRSGSEECPAPVQSPTEIVPLEAVVDGIASMSSNPADLVRRLEAVSPPERTGPPSSAFKRPSARRKRAQPLLEVVSERISDWTSNWQPAAEKTGEPVTPAADEARGSSAGAARVDPAEAQRHNSQLLGYLAAETRPAAPSPSAVQKTSSAAASDLGVPAQMPLVHSREQDRMRRKIVNDFLGKAVAKLLPSAGLAWSEVAPPMRLLVAGFHLTATNVTLTPSQWNLAAIVVLTHLMRQDAAVASLAPSADSWLTSVLTPFQLTADGLTPVLTRLATRTDASIADTSCGGGGDDNIGGSGGGPAAADCGEIDAPAARGRGDHISGSGGGPAAADCGEIDAPGARGRGSR